MKIELKIRLERFGKTVIGEVLDMDDSERGKGLLLRLYDNKIINELISSRYPLISNNRLYIKGELRLYDNEVFKVTYDTVGEAKQAYVDILRLVNEYNKQLNKPKFEESEEYKQQVKMNELLMDMRKWQFENDEEVDTTVVTCLYCIYIDIADYVKIKIDYSKVYRDIGAVYFSSREKAEECKRVFEDRIKEIYSK